MKFVVLVGSLRRASYNRAIANTLDELAPDQVDVSILESIGNLPHYNADLKFAGLPYLVSEMAMAIADADGFIIVTPEYNFSIPGSLKNALDWISRCDPQPLAGKPVAIQTASLGRLGGARCQTQLRQTLLSFDALVLNRPEVMIDRVATKVDQDSMLLRDEEARELVINQLAALAATVARLRPAEAA